MNIGELKDVVRRWSHRPDLSDQVLNEAITFANDRIVQEVWAQELDQQHEFDEKAAVNIRAQVWAYELPERCSRVWEVWNNNTRMESVRTGAIIETWGSQGNAGKPQKHTIVGSQLWVAPGAGGDMRCTYNKLDALLDASIASETNYGLTNFAHLYVWLTLARVAVWTMDDSGEALHSARYAAESEVYNNVQFARRRGGGATGTT